MSSTFFQVFPPSVRLVEAAVAAAAPQRALRRDVDDVGSRGSMTILPMCSESFSPMFSQVLPPSSDL